MPIPQLHFDDESEGLPRQLVPLRFAVLVTGLTVIQVIEMTTNAYQLSDDVNISLLDCHEFSGNKIRKCSLTATKALLTAVRTLGIEKERFKNIPSGWFVYSDELAAAFLNWIDFTVGLESVSLHDMGLNWNPALHPYEAEIKACSVMPASKSALSAREKRKRATAEKHSALYSDYIELKKNNPKKSDVQLSATIAKKYNKNPDTVRRIISDRKNS
ncbi:MAG: hypothetical protein IPM27_02420 [Nitrosomonadales bacterium]|nr:hypothetical protein [Nitrosomonadales bacterium]